MIIYNAEINGELKTVKLDGGKIVEESTPEAFFDHPKTERAQKFLRTFTFDSVK